ncbi:hypothetical protein J5U23_02603 [Saccharolobus shibatae B12]|uniref:Uncharacterized protein n=1 Tax=Saccharolobus shibatae (strain ATCC 51178 / DSM 5389 / JCM 8931 / NBRC 15437 / B12) TaxID=523848 RepID=A0A8F5GU71_SACSH|nr:hypothetical protein J5U23_02603 [Saccharolobus shibatae B12]
MALFTTTISGLNYKYIDRKIKIIQTVHFNSLIIGADQ